jgi:NADPH:quinone reductase-like Zn-dependent oxidoreductase
MKDNTMRAVIYDTWGGESVMQLREVPVPAPQAGQVQVKVHCASLNPIDYKLRNGIMKLLKKPRFPATTGKDFAGVVTALGSGVTGFAVGQRVFGSADALIGQGCCADALAIDVGLVAAIPDQVNDETAACLGVAAGSALQCLVTIAKVQKGQRVLVVGASGSVGAAGVQLAHALGAHVTGVCGTANVGYVESLGANRVIDYKKEAWEDGSGTYDVILDAGGAHTAFVKARRRLAAAGIYLDTFPNGMRFVNQFIASLLSKQRCVAFMLKTDRALLDALGVWAARGVLQPRVAERIALAEVPQALTRMEQGRVNGKVVVQMS